MLETKITRHVRLNRKYAVDLTYTPMAGLRVEWKPDLPREPLGKAEAARYRQARDELLAEVAERAGQRIMVVEA